MNSKLLRAQVLHDRVDVLEDPLQVRLYLGSLLAAGQPERAKAELQRLLAVDAEPRDYLGPDQDPKDLVRQLLLARLQAY